MKQMENEANKNNIVSGILEDIGYENCNGSIDGMRVYIKTMKRVVYILSHSNAINAAEREQIFSALEAKAQRTALSVHPELFW